MGVSRKKALEYAEQLLSRPRSRVPVTLYHGKTGVTLRHDGRTLTRCYHSVKGLMAAFFMAMALGLELPAVGGTVETQVSTGVLFRAISIGSLDVRTPEGQTLLQRMLEEAQMQRQHEDESA